MIYAFEAYQLDMQRYELRHGQQLCKLEPQEFNILAYLIQHRDRVVTKGELLEHLWPDQYVSEVTLSQRVMTLRKALGESGRAPRCIRTIHGRGYHFVAPVTLLMPSEVSPETSPVQENAPIQAAVPLPFSGGPSPSLVAREHELAQLHQHWHQALQGKRQIVFVTGEAGIGKTTVVNAFVGQVRVPESIWVGYGQCIEHYGSGEAYLPLLEALGELGRGPGGERLVAVLSRQAPSWLLQMPALVPAAEYESLRQRGHGVMRDRMLRELAEAIEAITAERPVLLVLEDLHWSDMSTLDWLTFIAHRRSSAHLLVVSTYRPAESAVRGHHIHAISQELNRQGQATELFLPYLSVEGVSAYLRKHFGTSSIPDALVEVLHQHTNGNPFFLVTIVEEWVRQGRLQRQGTIGFESQDLEVLDVDVPQSIRQLIDLQLGNLSPVDQEALAVASAVGREFSSVAVAACLTQAPDDVEACYDTLARRGQFVRSQGVIEWPDNTVVSQYAFIHDLYREVIYDQIPVSRRVRWHAQIGVRLEAGYANRTREVAAELAMHFVLAREPSRAAHYLQMAGEQAIQRSAHQEAIRHLSTGLDLLQTLPETPERIQQELALQVALAAPLMTTKGYGAPEVGYALARARELSQRIGDTPQLFQVVRGLWRFNQTGGNIRAAQELAKQCFHLAQGADDPAALLAAHVAMGITHYCLGNMAPARTHFEQALARYDPQAHRSLAFVYGEDLGVVSLARLGHILWMLGYPEQSLQRQHEALSLAQEVSHPYSLVYALAFGVQLRWLRREWQTLHEESEATRVLASEHGFAIWVAVSTGALAIAQAMQQPDDEVLAHLQQFLAAIRATGTKIHLPWLLAVLIEAYGQRQQATEGLAVLTEAFEVVDENGEGWNVPELYRLKGELLLIQAEPDELQAEAYLQQAFELARHQQAKILELRAAMSLARLWQSQDKRQEAYDLLAPVYGWFTEGFDTDDLKNAKTLLNELA